MKSIRSSQVASYNETSCIYFIPCLGGTKLNQINTYPAFYVDLDGKGVDSKIFKNNCRILFKTFGLEPSCVVETARGYHVYWVLNEPLNGPQGSPADLLWRSIQKKLRMFFDSDPAVCSPHQPMRLPFTWHRKDPANPIWVSVAEFSGIKYPVAVMEAATSQIEIIEKPDAPRPVGSAQLVLDSDNSMITAIIRGDTAYINHALEPSGTTVETLDELHHYLTNQIELSRFLGVSGTKFCCPFHDDSSPSAGIIVLDTGEHFFRCFGCGIRGNIRSLVRHIRGESSYRATQFLKNVFKVTLEETEYQVERRAILMDLKNSIREEIPKYSELYSNIRLDLLFYNVLIDEALRNIYDEKYTSATGQPIFFTSYSFLARLYGIKDRKTISRKVVNLALHQLIRRVPSHEVPLFLLSRSLEQQRTGGQQYRVSYYEISDLSPKRLLSANERALTMKSIGVTKQGFSREAILRSFGEQIASEVYEQGEHATTPVYDERQIDMIEFVMSRIEVTGFCYEHDLVGEMSRLWRQGQTVTRQRVKRLMPEMILKYGLSRLRLTKDLKARLGATAKGSKAVFVVSQDKQGRSV